MPCGVCALALCTYTLQGLSKGPRALRLWHLKDRRSVKPVARLHQRPSQDLHTSFVSLPQSNAHVALYSMLRIGSLTLFSLFSPLSQT